MGLILRIIVATAIGIALGLGATWALMRTAQDRATVRVGPWVTNLATGSASASPYTRLRIAIYGLLALNRSETLYFFAEDDSKGERLDGRCTYRIEGRDPDARWWSITSYGLDRFLIGNPRNVFSISQVSVAREVDGRFIAFASKDPREGNWLPAGAAGFVLYLRLYNPGTELSESPAKAQLPTITKEACS